MPVGATIAVASNQQNAAKKASEAAQAAQADTLGFTKGVYNTAQTNLQPTINEGNFAGSELSGLLGTGGDPAASQAAFDKYLGSTNYGFTLDQGEKGIQSANAPAFNSGATAKALTNYAEGQAGTALSGYEGLLSGQQSLGAQSALGLGGVGTSAGGIVNNANQGAADTEGSAAVYGANAWQNALAGIGKLAAQAASASSFGG